jgi:hypothetical protein
MTLERLPGYELRYLGALLVERYRRHVCAGLTPATARYERLVRATAERLADRLESGELDLAVRGAFGLCLPVAECGMAAARALGLSARHEQGTCHAAGTGLRIDPLEGWHHWLRLPGRAVLEGVRIETSWLVAANRPPECGVTYRPRP